MQLATLIDLYCQAWSEPSAERRAELIAIVWASGATYTDPTVHAAGASELLAHVSKVLARRPGSHVVRTSQLDEHHGVARFAWRAVEATGDVLLEGIDVALLSSDGSKIERIIGFFGALKPDQE